ncbi:RICIN domain-containing protein [Streptomyces coeruleorubidus]|uniref:RICIN domain-containing protein n=1 Tax=Streptomyces coeruleorubidus TaxID=116188 RepID=UPI00387EB2DF
MDTNAWYVLVNRGSGKALDVSGASTADGAALSQWARHDGANQRFQFVDSGGGYYRLKAQHSGKVLDVYNFSGASLQQQLDSSERQVVWRPGFSPAVRVQGRP